MEYSNMTNIVSQELKVCKKILAENNMVEYNEEIETLERFIQEISERELNQELMVKLINDFQMLINKIDSDMMALSGKLVNLRKSRQASLSYYQNK